MLLGGTGVIVADPSFANVCVGSKVGASGDVTDTTITATKLFVLPAHMDQHDGEHHDAEGGDGGSGSGEHHASNGVGFARSSARQGKGHFSKHGH